MRLTSLTLLLALLLTGCTGDDGNAPLAYDPPGSTNTEDKPITPVERQTVTVGTVSFTNDFSGGRFNEVEAAQDTIRLHIRPENAPVNNSAWYAFKVWADAPQDVTVQLRYEDGTHRYVPKLSPDGQTWTPIAPEQYAPDTTTGTATLRLPVGPDTLWVSGQELLTAAHYDAWSDSLAALPSVTKSTIGTSREERPLHKLTITDNAEADNYVLVMGRQHPPEVPGALASLAFLETVAADTDLARRFRQHFQVWAVPLMNPDGVENGHWRHNLGGIDLNRDWHHFNQPETRQVRDYFVTLNDDPDARVFMGLDFHSTQHDVFYTLDRELDAFPPGLIDRWLGAIGDRFPDYEVVDEPNVLGTPISKNWFFETFGTTGVTYEVGDEEDRDQLRAIAIAAAEAMMELLLDDIDA